MQSKSLTSADLATKLKSAKQGKNGKLLTRRQVAERLGVCTHTIQRLTRRGSLPALVFNRRLIRYSEEAVDTFIASGQVQRTAV